MLQAGSANGVKLPPYIIYKVVHLYARWTEGGPAGARYGVSMSGWMEGENFLDWFRSTFIQQFVTY